MVGMAMGDQQPAGWPHREWAGEQLPPEVTRRIGCEPAIDERPSIRVREHP
ncbi:hypothetical protein D3C83_101270 [compost metagenome]